MKPQCCNPVDYSGMVQRKYKDGKRLKVDMKNPRYKIKNISPREQLLAELAEREKTLSK